MAQKFLNARTAADRVGCAYVTALARFLDGRVPTVRSEFDGKLYIRESDLPLLAATLPSAERRARQGAGPRRRAAKGGAR